MLSEPVAHALDWLGKVLAYSVPAAGFVFALFRCWEFMDWAISQQKELERLRHLLNSRVSRIHEKQFEVLPQAWLMLNELQGTIAHAFDLTIKYYPNLRAFPTQS